MASETFALQLGRFAEKAGENAQKVIRKVSIDLLSGIVLRTPVGNPDLWASKPPKGYVGGRLRANWNVSLATPDTTTTTLTDDSGQQTINTGSVTINAFQDQPIYIVNSLPYVREIEYEGHSKQAPAGMLRITVSEFQNFVNQAANEVRT